MTQHATLRAVHRAGELTADAASVVETCASNDTIACLTKLEQNIDASSKQLAKLLQHQRDASHRPSRNGRHEDGNGIRTDAKRPDDVAAVTSCTAVATTLGRGFHATYNASHDRCDVVYNDGKDKCYLLVSYTEHVTDTLFDPTAKTVQDALGKCTTADGCDSVYFARDKSNVALAQDRTLSLNFGKITTNQTVAADGHGAYVFRKVDCDASATPTRSRSTSSVQ